MSSTYHKPIKLYGFTENIQDHEDSIAIYQALKNHKQYHRRCLKILRQIHKEFPVEFHKASLASANLWKNTLRLNQKVYTEEIQCANKYIEFHTWIKDIETIDIDSITDLQYKYCASNLLNDIFLLLDIDYVYEEDDDDETCFIGGDLIGKECGDEHDNKRNIPIEPLDDFKKRIENTLIRIFGQKDIGIVETTLYDYYKDDDDD